MSYITGFDRTQTSLFPQSIDQIIEKDNPVRFIDLFVNSIKAEKYGFRDVALNTNGRPPFHPSDLLKLYIYGYINKIRSSRGLERECKRNIELIWLLKGLVPDHNTISNFRKDNPQAIKKVFRQTVSLAKNLDLIGGILIAGDGTKLRAQNSKKNNYNQKKIDRHLSYIESKLEEYNKDLSKADGDEKQVIEEKIEKQNLHKTKYKVIEEQLQKSGEKQVSTSDPESRQLMIRGVITEVAYNVQSTVDSKNKLPIDYQVTNQNDRNALSSMVRRAKTILRTDKFDAVFDKGYHNAEQIHSCHQMGVETHVAITAPSANAPDKAYNLSEFNYNKENDTYTCPANQRLITNGNWYQKKAYKVKQYKTKECKNCPVKSSCTKAKGQRIIERHEFAEALERNKQIQEEKPEIYKQRQSLVEHPFGTMKRGWGFDHIITKKTKSRASADVGFIFIAYNLKRILNIIGLEELMKQLMVFVSFLSLLATQFIRKKLETLFLLLNYFFDKISYKSPKTYYF